jgi:hypothetical protein
MTSARASRRAIRWSAVAVVAGSGLAVCGLAGCGQRDRPTFPTENPGNSAGPVTVILQPEAPDTTVVEGDLVFVDGRASDPDGVDTVYFEIGGLNQSFSPLDGEGADTVRFALQLSTLGHTGATATVRVYAVDLLGDRGSAVTRQIRVQ